MSWHRVTPDQPEEGEVVVGFKQDWVDVDFNPKGVRECFRVGDIFISAKWSDHHDWYLTDVEDAPTHFMRIERMPGVFIK